MASGLFLSRTPQQRTASDAYFEGGYWLDLWQWLYGLLIAWILLNFGISTKMRDLGGEPEGLLVDKMPLNTMIQFHTLEKTAAFYASVMGLWRRYASLLPLRVATVRYEDMVTDFEGETRRLLGLLELKWDEAVGDHSQRVRQEPVSTPSYHQVVQPLYSRSIGRWHNYRFAFDALMPVLLPFLRAWGYTETEQAAP